MLAENKIPNEADPVDVFDNILQSCSVFAHQQGFKKGLNINKQTLKLISQAVRVRKQLALVLDENGTSIKLKMGVKKA